MKNASARTEARAAEQADGGSVARGGSTPALTDNLRRAAAGDVGSQRLMSSALKTAALRDARYRRPLGYTRSWGRYYADRAAERALVAASWYRQLLEERTAGVSHA